MCTARSRPLVLLYRRLIIFNICRALIYSVLLVLELLHRSPTRWKALVVDKAAADEEGFFHRLVLTICHSLSAPGQVVVSVKPPDGISDPVFEALVRAVVRRCGYGEKDACSKLVSRNSSATGYNRLCDLLDAVPEVENIYCALRSVVHDHEGQYVQNVFNG